MSILRSFCGSFLVLVPISGLNSWEKCDAISAKWGAKSKRCVLKHTDLLLLGHLIGPGRTNRLLVHYRWDLQPWFWFHCSYHILCQWGEWGSIFQVLRFRKKQIIRWERSRFFFISYILLFGFLRMLHVHHESVKCGHSGGFRCVSVWALSLNAPLAAYVMFGHQSKSERDSEWKSKRPSGLRLGVNSANENLCTPPSGDGELGSKRRAEFHGDH